MNTATLPARRPDRGGGSFRNNGRVTPAIIIGNQVRIPASIHDLASFRLWTLSRDYPERGDFSYLNGQLWVDLSMETSAHNLIKTAITAVLAYLIAKSRLGRLYSDGMRLVHLDADLACEPDGMFLSRETLSSGRVKLAEREQSLEIVGTPDMVLEVISKTTVEKDTVELKALYARAGIPEYWLIDSCDPAPRLQIYRLSRGKYVHARRQGDWVRSAIFGKQFRLNIDSEAQDESPYALLVR